MPARHHVPTLSYTLWQRSLPTTSPHRCGCLCLWVLRCRLHFGSAGVQERGPGQEVLPTFTKCTGKPNVHVSNAVPGAASYVSVSAVQYAWGTGVTGLVTVGCGLGLPNTAAAVG